MFVVPDEVPSTEEGAAVISADADLMAIKPMNCPAHVQIFKQGIKSYRDCPFAWPSLVVVTAMRRMARCTG